MRIIHKIIKNGECFPWVYLCNQAVSPKDFDKSSYSWKSVTCRNCLKQKPEDVCVKPRKNLFRVVFLLLVWFFAVGFWWIVLPVGNFANWVAGFNYHRSFDEYFEFLAEELRCIIDRGGLCD